MAALPFPFFKNKSTRKGNMNMNKVAKTRDDTMRKYKKKQVIKGYQGEVNTDLDMEQTRKKEVQEDVLCIK